MKYVNKQQPHVNEISSIMWEETEMEDTLLSATNARR